MQTTGGGYARRATFVITGFSRGAAAANILACKLVDQGIAQSQIYTYAFACPDTAWITENKAASYHCIFNIADANDFVSWIPRVMFGVVGNVWNKYGRSYWYSDVWEDYEKLEMGMALIIRQSIFHICVLKKICPNTGNGQRRKKLWIMPTQEECRKKSKICFQI